MYSANRSKYKSLMQWHIFCSFVSLVSDFEWVQRISINKFNVTQTNCKVLFSHRRILRPSSVKRYAKYHTECHKWHDWKFSFFISKFEWAVRQKKTCVDFAFVYFFLIQILLLEIFRHSWFNRLKIQLLFSSFSSLIS